MAEHLLLKSLTGDIDHLGEQMGSNTVQPQFVFRLIPARVFFLFNLPPAVHIMFHLFIVICMASTQLA